MLTDLQFYMLGWLYASLPSLCVIESHRLTLKSDQYDNDRDVYRHLEKLVRGNTDYRLVVTDHKPGYWTLYIYDGMIIENVDKCFDSLLFKRGYFDACGTIEIKGDDVFICSVPGFENSCRVFKTDIEKYNAKYLYEHTSYGDDDDWYWVGLNALKFMCKLYNIVDGNVPPDEYYLKSNLDLVIRGKENWG